MGMKHKRIANYLRDALILLVVGWQLYSGAMLHPGNDATRYQCYAVAFWQGWAGFEKLSPGQCTFLVDPDQNLTLISQHGLLHVLQQWRVLSGLIHFVAAQSPEQPYHTLPYEYPWLMLLPFSLPLLAPANCYQMVFAIEMVLLVGCLYLVLLRWRSQQAALACLLYVVAGSSSTAAARYDLIPAALTLFAVICAAHKRWNWAFAVLALAALTKFYPAILLVPFFLALQSTTQGKWYAWRRWLPMATFLGVCVLVVGLSLLLSVEGTLAPLGFFGNRPVQIESLPASILWLLSKTSLIYTFTFGSVNVLSPLSWSVTGPLLALLAVGLLSTWWLQWRQRMNLGMDCLLTLLLVIITGKIFSPQYLLWVLPLAAYVGQGNRWWLLFWIGIGCLTTWIYPYIYNATSLMQVPYLPEFYLATTVRNFLLVGFILSILICLWMEIYPIKFIDALFVNGYHKLLHLSMLMVFISLTLLVLLLTRIHLTHAEVSGNTFSYDKLDRLLMAILILEMITLLYFFLKNHFQLPKKIVLVIVLGVLLRMLYLSYTPYTDRTYDVLEPGGHLDYITYVATNFHLPNPNMDSGWEYHQAPLYYITAAVVYKISENLALNSLSLLQVLSLLYSTVFLMFGVLLLQRICKREWLFFTATALLVFWPSGIIHSIRVGNDPMYYMVSVIGLYFLMQWIIGKQSKHFYIAALFVALTIATKLNGLLVLGIFVCFFLLHMVSDRRAIGRNGQLKKAHENECDISNLHQGRWLDLKQQHTAAYLKKTLFLISVVVLACSFSLFRNALTALQDPHFDILNGSSAYTMNRGLSVGNNVTNFLYFDIKTYITKPFTDTWNDVGGRQYFWNFFLKSMLFGEFNFPSAIEQHVAKFLSALLLQMMVVFFVGFFVSIRKFKPLHFMLLFWWMLSVLSLLYYRHTYPFSPNGDFRFIFPAIIPFIYFYLAGIDYLIEHKLRIIGIFGYILVYLFIIGSCFFFIIPLGT
jgi:hypothetical protein